MNEVEELNRDFTRSCEQSRNQQTPRMESSVAVAPTASDPKVKEILSYVGKSVTVMSRQKYGHGFLEGFWGGDPIVANCTALYVTIEDRMTKEIQSFALNQVEVTFDHKHDRLQLRIDR